MSRFRKKSYSKKVDWKLFPRFKEIHGEYPEKETIEYSQYWQTFFIYAHDNASSPGFDSLRERLTGEAVPLSMAGCLRVLDMDLEPEMQEKIEARLYQFIDNELDLSTLYD